MTDDVVIRETITLDRVQLHSVQLLDETLLAGMRKDVRVCDHADAYEMRRSFTGWGRIERRTLTCPSTWWQHIKLAVRTRWPRLFGRLRVAMVEVTVENGAIVTGLKRLPARHQVIPIAMPTYQRSYVDDPSQEDA